jgi:arylsulfatase A-like enzyme
MPSCTLFRDAPDPKPPRPNVLIIVTDDQPLAGTMDVMPKTREWFATAGTTYTRAYVTTPLCCPSRASIMTGLYTHNHGVQVDMHGDAELLDQSLTMQRALREAGYTTGYFGKYLNGWPLSVDPPHFDSWSIFDNSSPHGYRNGPWNDQGRRRKIRRYSTTYLGEQAASFIRAGSERRNPWMLYVATAAPHKPYEAERRYTGAAVPDFDVPEEADLRDKPPFVRRLRVPAKRGEEVRLGQMRTLMSVDDMVGRIRRTLEATGEAGNTMVFFLSDNGYLWGHHTLVGKMTPYTPSIAVPFMAAWPGEIGRGDTDGRLVTNLDIAPTVYDAARIRHHPALDGDSLLEASTRKRILFEFWAAYGRPSWSSLVTKEYQYVEYTDDRDRVTFREYYDLVTDPEQMENLLGDDDPSNDPDVERLRSRLARDRRCAGASCP